MGFQIVEGTPRVIWAPVDYGSGGAATVYEGALVVSGAVATAQGVKVWTPAGNADTTADQVPFGIVLASNDSDPTYETTYTAGGQYVASVQSQANLLARKFRGAEGMYAKGEPLALVKIAVIDPTTVLKGQIFNAAFGTAPTVATVSTASTTGLGYTSSAHEFTPVAYNATYFCRSGANRGLYRIGYDTSTTVKTFYQAFPYDIAVGDTFVGANIAAHGTCKACIGTGGTYLNNGATVSSDYIWIDVLELNLETAGAEHAIFRINPLQFLAVRA